MTENRDVVVIGGGIAGTAAALAAANRGGRVVLITAAPGASALGSGGWSGVLPAPLANAFTNVGHEWLAVRDALPAPDGSLRHFEYAASNQAAAVLERGTMVCGIAGLPGFHAAMLARMWGESAGVDLVSHQVTLPNTPRAGWSPPNLAARIEQDSAPLVAALAPAVRATGANRIIVPAVLGLEQASAVRVALERGSGASIGEALGGIPAVPGWRLQLALERMIGRSPVEVLRGRVVNRSAQSTRIESVTVQVGDGPGQTIAARAVVLATGKFVGGGISGNGVFRETALGCPVWIDHLGERFERVEPLTLTNADRHEDQPLLAAGVTVDAEGRPLNQHGDPVFTNVWVAGATCAGHDPGLGRAAIEGWAAGERATS